MHLGAILPSVPGLRPNRITEVVQVKVIRTNIKTKTIVVITVTKVTTATNLIRAIRAITMIRIKVANTIKAIRANTVI